MKRFVSVVLAIALVTVLAGAALAFMGPGGRGMGGGMMGMGPGHGAWGAGPGPAGCPGMTGTGPATPAQITEEKAKEVAKEYVEKYFKGFTVERVLPFTGMRGHTMYTVELKGPKDETRTLHINPWGNVMPFGGPVS